MVSVIEKMVFVTEKIFSFTPTMVGMVGQSLAHRSLDLLDRNMQPRSLQ